MIIKSFKSPGANKTFKRLPGGFRIGAFGFGFLIASDAIQEPQYIWPPTSALLDSQELVELDHNDNVIRTKG